MDNIAIKINGKSFGSMNLGKKKPYITIQEGNKIKSYGQFRSIEEANEFFDVLYESIIKSIDSVNE